MNDRRRRVLDVTAVLVTVAGWSYILLAPDRVAAGAREVVVIPDIAVEAGPEGGQVVVADPFALRSAFARARLPDPPDLNGADPVPVGKLLDLARAWAARRDVAALGRLAQVYQALLEHEAALGCFAAAARLNPDDVRWQYGLGVEYQTLGLQERAIEALDRAGEMDPDYPTTYARLGALFLERGELDRAAAAYEAYRQRLPGRSLGYVGLGRVALARGQADRAEAYLRDAVERTPNDFLAHRLLGVAFAAAGKPELARREQRIAERLPQYSGWLTFDPRVQEAHELADTRRFLTNRMRAAAGAGNFAAMAGAAKRLLERRPDDFSVLGHLATAYREQGQLQLADEAIDRALAIEPGHAALHSVRAAIAFSRDDYSATHYALDAALAIDPGSARAHEMRGRTWFLQGRYEQGIAAVRRAIALDPNRIDARLLLVAMLRQGGRTNEAIETVQELIELDPQNEQLQRLLLGLGGSTQRR